jgi:hypothetical protein
MTGILDPAITYNPLTRITVGGLEVSSAFSAALTLLSLTLVLAFSLRWCHVDHSLTCFTTSSATFP